MTTKRNKTLDPFSGAVDKSSSLIGSNTPEEEARIVKVVCGARAVVDAADASLILSYLGVNPALARA